MKVCMNECVKNFATDASIGDLPNFVKMFVLDFVTNSSVSMC